MVLAFQQFCKELKSKCSSKTLFLCFSATFNDEVQRFMEEFVPEPRAELIVKKKAEWSVAQIRQYYVDCTEMGKYHALKTLYEYISVGSCILFVEVCCYSQERERERERERVCVLLRRETKLIPVCNSTRQDKLQACSHAT
jgi:superfamily II DNA/RNA helicase